MQISDVEVYDVTLTGIWSVANVWYHVCIISLSALAMVVVW